ncbi:MAG: serine protease [Thermoplasmata archaeon]|nr:MAG: serine protease [Thermoplasmata archaeon]
MKVERTDRMKLIKKIEEKRGSRLLVYITGDRKGLETRIGMDVFPMFHDHLMHMGEQERIDLYLYSPGGITIAGYALVNLIREFCKEFNVIIPFKALSCATLISLGADEVIMTPMGQLSPIDPSVQHPLGPVIQIPGQPMGQIVPVNVEDVNAFVDLARKEVGLNNEESMKKVFELLGTKIHPLALGAVQRSREQIAFLASNLLGYHINDNKKIKRIVKILTRERFSHQYIIGRREGREILELNIKEPEEDLLRDIIDLFNVYSQILELNTPYNPEIYLSESESGIFDFNRAIIESSNLTHVFRTKKEIRRVQVPPQPGMPIPAIGYQERILQEGWILDNTI